MTKKISSVVLFLLVGLVAGAQDPHYTQFYSAPLTVNPAYTGVFHGQARVMSNYRQQWGNLSSPFTTALVSADVKVAKDKGNSTNPLNIGIQFMNDRSMKGAFRSNYATLTASYFVPLDEDGYKSFGAGLSGSYGDRRIDFSGLSFDEQFMSGGFNLALPTGEIALQSMKPFATVGAGILYRYDNTETGDFFDLGLSAYHLNKPMQSVLNDPNQFLPVRISGQISYQKYLNDQSLINLRGLYQNQASVNYFLAGFSFAKLLGSNKDMVGAGIWYRSSDAVSPYVFVEYSQLQLGFSYDVTLSELKSGPTAARSIEMSLQWRLGK